MKNFIFSSIVLYAIEWILIFNPTTAQSANSPQGNNFLNTQSKNISKFDNSLEGDRHRVWLNLTSKQGLSKQILIAYIEGATNGWDVNYDGPTLNSNRLGDFFTINEDRKLVIEGRALPFEKSDTVPLGYRTSNAGDLTISIDRTDGDLDNQDIYIQDNQTGTMHNLKNGSYTFSSAIGTFKERFVIRYNNTKLATDTFQTSKKDLLVASKDKIISLRSNDSVLKEVFVFDITGQLLYSNQKIDSAQLEIASIESGTQILLVKTILENGYTISRKVFF